MDELDDELLTFDASKLVKTYPKADKTPKPAKNAEEMISQMPPPPTKRVPLTTKEAVKFLLEGSLQSKVCRYCLNVAPQLSELDQIFQVADKGTFYNVTIKDMVASFHPFKAENDPNFPDKICEKCLDRTLSSYLFTQQCEQAERALRNCLEDMYDQVEKLDPIERPKKRGRHKLKPNCNTLYTEHEKVINYADPKILIVNTVSESLVDQPPINELECLKCCQLLPNLESLLNHTKTHPKSMWYNCRLCGTSFPKLHQLKKHFRHEHSPKAPPKHPEEPTKFDCKRCGVVSENYSAYLQHIEKHKFKMLMEHLVDKKMDKLCSICFNKGGDMVPLDKMICLHGGCPELTGDRPLHTILASTLPDKKNKYRELLVPTQASIMRLVKKKNESKRGTNFPLPNPSIITVEKLNFDDYYLFFFSGPQLSYSDNIIEIDDVEIPVVQNVIESIDENENCVSKICIEPLAIETKNTDCLEFDQDHPEPDVMTGNEIDQLKTPDNIVNFTFLHLDVQNEDTKYETNEPKKLKESEGGLKFEDAKNAVTISIENTQNNIEITDSETCNYCWVFKNLDKCDFCKKSNDSLRNTNSNDVSEASQHIRADTHENISSNTQKENLKVADKNTTNDNLTWQCNICLINNNKDRETCDCCEAKPLINVEKNIFKFNHIIGYNDSLNHNVQKTDTATPKFDIPSTSDFKIVQELYPSPDNLTVINNKVSNIDPEEIFLMETEMLEVGHNPIKFSDSFTNECEAMDIEDTEIGRQSFLQINEANYTNIGSNAIFPAVASVVMDEHVNNNTFIAKQFQFTIGSGSGESPRKLKKPLRNMARTRK